MSEKTITWTYDMLQRFKQAYAKAKAENADTFIFDGNEFVLGYAAYLIQYLDSKVWSA